MDDSIYIQLPISIFNIHLHIHSTVALAKLCLRTRGFSYDDDTGPALEEFSKGQHIQKSYNTTIIYNRGMHKSVYAHTKKEVGMSAGDMM